MIDINIKTQQKHTISPYLYMQFMEPLGVCDTSVDAAWDFAEQKWYDQVIDKAKELGPTMVRFGGCFASYYHWKEAVGPRDKRIPVKNHCWGSVPYHNQIGTHEIIDLCRKTNSEPLLVVNMESDGRKHWAYPKNDTVRLGTAAEAAEWIRYCNDADNPLRLSHGHEEPYNVKYWQIGNETSYVSNGFNVDECVDVTKRFVADMRKADPNVVLLGWGDEHSKTKVGWPKKMSEVDGIDMLAFHHHFCSNLPNSPLYGNEYRKDYDATWQHLMSAYTCMQPHIDYMRANCGNKRLAITEGHFVLPGRNRCEVLSSWGAGVAYARCLNVIHRNTDIIDIATMADFFGNVWQVNALLIPNRQPAYLQPVGSVMSLFRLHQGRYAADISYTGDIDAVASMDEGKLYIHVANTDRHRSQHLSLDLGGKTATGATMYYIAEASYVEVTPSNPDVFKPKSMTVDARDIVLPPAAVAAIEVSFE